jgi:predicted GIY-YIG superfamily endonuclease
MPPWSVYIVRCKDGSLYTGIATNVEERIAKHNAGKGAKYTRSRCPVVLVWQEAAVSESAARIREVAIKRMKKAEKEALLQ